MPTPLSPHLVWFLSGVLMLLGIVMVIFHEKIQMFSVQRDERMYRDAKWFPELADSNKGVVPKFSIITCDLGLVFISIVLFAVSISDLIGYDLDHLIYGTPSRRVF